MSDDDVKPFSIADRITFGFVGAVGAAVILTILVTELCASCSI
jgi:hypothetical protein